MVSVQFQIVPFPHLYFISRSIGPFQCSVNANYRVLICCSCHFQSGGSDTAFFIFTSSVCKSLQCLISTLTQGAKVVHLFRLSHSVLLWSGRNRGNKHHWCVWGVFTVYGPHWFCRSSPWHVLSQSTLLRLQVAMRGNCPKQSLCCVHFPGLSCSGSGSWVLLKGTDLVGCAFCALPRSENLRPPGAWQVQCQGGPFISITSLVLAPWFPRCIRRAPSQVCHVSPLGR